MMTVSALPSAPPRAPCGTGASGEKLGEGSTAVSSFEGLVLEVSGTTSDELPEQEGTDEREHREDSREPVFETYPCHPLHGAAFLMMCSMAGGGVDEAAEAPQPGDTSGERPGMNAGQIDGRPAKADKESHERRTRGPTLHASHAMPILAAADIKIAEKSQGADRPILSAEARAALSWLEGRDRKPVLSSNQSLEVVSVEKEPVRRPVLPLHDIVDLALGPQGLPPMLPAAVDHPDQTRDVGLVDQLAPPLRDAVAETMRALPPLSRQITIRLTPDDLGLVTITLTRSSDELMIRIVPEQRTAVEALAVDMHLLEEVLQPSLSDAIRITATVEAARTSDLGNEMFQGASSQLGNGGQASESDRRSRPPAGTDLAGPNKKESGEREQTTGGSSSRHIRMV